MAPTPVSFLEMKCTFRARSAQASLSCASTEAPADEVTLAEAETLMVAAVAQFTSVGVAEAALGAVRDAMKICETGKSKGTYTKAEICISERSRRI